MSEKRKAPDVPGGLLGNIISGVAAMPAQPKRPRAGERNMGEHPSQALAKKLHQIRDEFHTMLQQLSPVRGPGLLVCACAAERVQQQCARPRRRPGLATSLPALGAVHRDVRAAASSAVAPTSASQIQAAHA